MKKTLRLILCGLLLTVVLSGCAQNTVETEIEENPLTAHVEKVDEASTQGENLKQNTQDNSETSKVNENHELNEISEQEKAQAQDEIFAHVEVEAENELTQEEMDFFTEFMNSMENNGFLNSEYLTPVDVDLNEVFYNGAGISEHSLTDEENAAYEEETGWVVSTDIEKLTTEEIDNFLINKTGYSFLEMNKPLGWLYLEQYDVYISEHGDTNWRAFTCIGGKIEGDIYEIYYTTEFGQEDGILTLKKNGEDYLIVSNQYDYVPDLSGLSDEEIRQLGVFAQNKEVWNMEDYEPLTFHYTVFDLDKDGRLELITSATAGTGIYTENHFYHTDDEFSKLEELPQEYCDEYSELDINFNGDGAIYYDGSIFYYPSYDFSKNGAAENYNFDGAYYIKDGIVYSVEYRGTHALWHDEDNSEQTYYDAEGNEITQDKWDTLEDEFYAGMETGYYSMIWNDIKPAELKLTSESKLFRILAESYMDGAAYVYQ
ncbi:MAG: hypothetical protein NC433_03205 [Clostridiales bacterium]|nr:hypothetical protein [Clostridiales bacterium]